MPLPKILLFGKIGQVGWELRRTLAPMSQLICVDYPEVDFTQPDAIRTWIDTHRNQVVVVLSLAVGLWLVAKSMAALVG